MLTPKQLKLFEAFLRKPYQELTYKHIKDYSHEKSNSVVQKAITAFLAEDLVKKREVGNMLLYSVNMEKGTVFSYFNIMVTEETSNLTKSSLKIIQEELSPIWFKSLIIFGSYAEGKQNKKSDLDIAVFVNSEEDKRRCVLALKSAELKSLLQIDAHVITAHEMLQMLGDKHENLGKQIASKHLVVQNPMIFYAILAEGMHHGFKLVYS